MKEKTRFGQLPILAIDGEELYQSTAIVNYCAKVSGLYPKDDITAAKVDEIVTFVNQDVKDRMIAKSMASGLTDEKKVSDVVRLSKS